MATFDAVTLTGDVDTGANATITVAHTAAAGSVMLVWAMHDTHNTSSMTWNTTESLTSVQATVDDSGGGSEKLAMFMLIPTATGLHNVVVTYAGTTGGTSRMVVVMTWTGVETGSAVAGTHRAVAHGVTPLSVTSVSGDTVVCVNAALAVSPGPVSGQTARGTQFNAPGGTNNWIAAGSTVAAGVSTSMSFTGGAGFDTLIGIALIDAAAGAAKVPYQPNYQWAPLRAQ